MKIHNLTPAITWIEPASMSNFSACGGLFIESPRRVGIDTNFGTETGAWLRAAKPEILIASHYHIDHVATLKHGQMEGIERLMLPVEELPMVQHPENFHRLVDHQGELQRFWIDLLDRYRFWPTASVQGLDVAVLADLELGLLAVPTPGHSPGHYSFFFPEQGILFTGDMGIDPFGPWYCWPDCDLAALVSSLWRLRALEATTLLTSHGGMVTGHRACAEAFDKALDIIVRREEQIARWTAEGLDDTEIIARGLIYPGHAKYKTEFRYLMGYWEEKTLAQHRAALAAGGILAAKNREETCT